MRSVVDYLVLGAGIVGITIARELNVREPKAKILVLEKELKSGMHTNMGSVSKCWMNSNCERPCVSGHR